MVEILTGQREHTGDPCGQENQDCCLSDCVITEQKGEAQERPGSYPEARELSYIPNCFCFGSRSYSDSSVVF